MTRIDLLAPIVNNSGYKLRFIASKVEMSYPNFLDKLRGKRDFTLCEVEKLCTMLQIDGETALKIFLPGLTT